jgi:hypothetical protein
MDDRSATIERDRLRLLQPKNADHAISNAATSVIAATRSEHALVERALEAADRIHDFLAGPDRDTRSLANAASRQNRVTLVPRWLPPLQSAGRATPDDPGPAPPSNNAA